MAKEKVTLTLDADQLRALRERVGARSVSATVDLAVAARLAELRHLDAVDNWLAALEDEHGPVPDDAIAWASEVVDRWSASAGAVGRQAG